MALKFCTNHTAKMEGMISLSTSCSHNPCCIRNAAISGSICEKCYAQTMMKLYHGLEDEGDENAKQLTTALIPMKELPFVNARFCRLEAFGDLHNETHLVNYLRLAKKNPHCRFTLWTKNYPVVLKYFKTHSAPNNFTLIISSLFINKPMIPILEKLQSFGSVKNLKLFTVYDKDEALKNGIKINCGGRKCMQCLQCYKTGKTDVIINEMLKSQKNAYEKALAKKLEKKGGTTK